MMLRALEFSLGMGCKLQCKYCPQELLLSRYYSADKNRKKKLSYKDFVTALEQVEPGGEISFSGMSEPFFNKCCADMIVYASQKGYKISLNTTLMGMTREDFNKIRNVEFDNFVLHVPDVEGNSRFEISDEYLELFKCVNREINIDYYSCHGTIHPSVEGLVDRQKYLGIKLHNRAGNLSIEGIESFEMSSEIICQNGLEMKIGGWSPVMLPDGSLVLCCMDYGMKHVLGNLVTQTWEEIAAGEEYNRFIRGLLDDTVDILCRKCSNAVEVRNLPAMRLHHMVEMEGERSDNGIVKRFAAADHVCVFGLGKYWKDHFVREYWNKGMRVSILSDNRMELWGKELEGFPIVSPGSLRQYKNLLVVIFIRQGEQIVRQLSEMGIDNCIMIDDVMEEFR